MLSTDELEYYGSILNESDSLNEVGKYLRSLSIEKQEIEKRMAELPMLEKLIEEYNQFNFQEGIS